MNGRTTAPAVTFGVLGPVVAGNHLGPVALKGPRHRAVLARLLVARGRVVPVDRLADDLWATPPHAPVAAIRTFVADLRRALEPDRPPRQPARLLVTAAPGYALHPEPDAVDAWRFEAAVDEAGRLLAAGQADRALACLRDALALWRGPAYAEHATDGWARAEIDRLDELQLLAVQRRAEALLALGRAAEAATDLRAHADGHPLREDAWRLFALALYRAGRQGDALAALRRARATLAAELGVDPGPGLRQMEADVLAQAPHLSLAGIPDLPRAPVVVRPAPPPEAGTSFVGRGEEQARLLAAAGDVARRGRPAMALVSGDPGAGKTALVGALTRRLTGDGWTVAWGRSPEYDGAPVAWPWTQITDALTRASPDGLAAAPPDIAPEPDDWDTFGAPDSRTVADAGGDIAGAADSGKLAGAAGGGDTAGGTEDPAVARFRLHRAVTALVTAAARRGPVLLVLDDLHRADGDTLDLLTALLTPPQPVTGPVLVVGTFRATEISPELTAALARCARLEPLRVYLGGLPEQATGELARAVARRDLDAATARLIHRRTGGNPFFVRELARLLAEEGDTALDTVPTGVRDVIRHRLAQLPDPAQSVLRQAAVLGREIDPDVLTALTGDDAVTLDALDRAVQTGFLTEHGPHRRLRFTHILVRDTLYGDLSALRRARWHAAAGDAVERLRPHDAATLAHHLALAPGPAAAGRAARYARTAAEQAERRCHPHEAARLWQQAVAAHDRAGHGDTRERLTALLGLGRTLAVTGHLEQARRHRAEAIDTARRIDDSDLTVAVLTAFEVPAVWTRNDDESLSRSIVGAAERALTVPGGDTQRSRLLSTLALELRGTTTDRGRRAAGEAESIARAADNPALLAFALNARFMHAFDRPGRAPQRARIGAELVDVAARHDLVTFEVLGHLVLLQAHCALADLDAADVDARAAEHLADRYDLPLVGVFTRWYAALRLAIAGRLADAEAAYRVAHARLAGSGMPGMERGMLPLALLSLRLARHPGTGVADLSSVPPDRGWDDWDWGPYEPWVRPLLLLSAGHRDEAAAALRALPDSPHDLLWEARLCLAGRAALALGDRATMRRVHAELLPAAGELAGAGSGVLTLGPVAGHLADLDAALGRPGEG
ncbi:BTAD domain-containing putative transcriptional regulator [Micromonospora rubida]